ncbi:hypothetical protein [Aliarcobacter butzleri]|uniref:hypothetical protein n=1 Tax=Aliarcobacter butzleri TaxID=28197 RepID=UPI001EDC1AD8|nr:hypothetical protein [Aliarcobacter butzleri]MCG3657959.1 hypothetical protein [Aliarcobacter butzleri]
MNLLVVLHDKINKQLAKDSFVYRFNWCNLFFALVFTILLYYFDDGYDNAFVRSGVILIIFGVTVEYTLSNIKLYENSSSLIVDGHPIQRQKELPKKHKEQKMLAHFYILYGTLIWGFGDLLPNSFFIFR